MAGINQVSGIDWWETPAVPSAYLLEYGWDVFFENLSRMKEIGGLKIISNDRKHGIDEIPYSEVSLGHSPSGETETVLIVKKKIHLGHPLGLAEDDMDLLSSLSSIGFNASPIDLMCSVSFRIRSIFVSPSYQDLYDKVIMRTKYAISLSVVDLPDQILGISLEDLNSPIINSFGLKRSIFRKDLVFQTAINPVYLRDVSTTSHCLELKIQEEMHRGFAHQAKKETLQLLYNLIEKHVS